jgi:hypothetical protein
MCCLLFFTAAAQNRTVTGQVSDAKTGETLIGVSILLKGTTQGTSSDGNGKFSISVPNNAAVLVFNYLGYAIREVTVGEQRQISIKMSPDETNLNDVVVIGYGTVKKRDLTGAVVSVNSA